MGSKRGAANLAKFNEQRSATILPLVVRELQLCRKRKLEFRTVGQLAAHLSDRVKVNRTTLLRNPRYHSLLADHIATQPGAVTLTQDSTMNPAVLQAKLAAAKLDASTLREHLKVATRKLERLSGASASSLGDSDRVAVADIAMVLVALLTRYPDFLRMDFDRRELHDLSAKPSERVIAGPERLAAFSVWVAQNQALPQLKKLRLTPYR